MFTSHTASIPLFIQTHQSGCHCFHESMGWLVGWEFWATKLVSDLHYSVQMSSTKAESGWIGYAYGGADQKVFLHIREVKDGSTLMWSCHYPNFLLSTPVISLRWSPWTCLYLKWFAQFYFCTFHMRICLVQVASTFDKLRCQVVLCGPSPHHLRCLFWSIFSRHLLTSSLVAVCCNFFNWRWIDRRSIKRRSSITALIERKYPTGWALSCPAGRFHRPPGARATGPTDLPKSRYENGLKMALGVF
jgi:hypothetical protein